MTMYAENDIQKLLEGITKGIWIERVRKTTTAHGQGASNNKSSTQSLSILTYDSD